MSSTNYSYAHNLSKILKDEQEDDQKVEEALHYVNSCTRISSLFSYNG